MLMLITTEGLQKKFRRLQRAIADYSKVIELKADYISDAFYNRALQNII